MKKIISVFQRNYDGDRLIRNEVVPGAEWVLSGEGKATVKYDGCCCMVRDGRLYKRFELKKGKTAPAGFDAAQEPDSVTGDQPGWISVGDVPEDKWFRVALESVNALMLQDGTYEAVGRHFQGGAEGQEDTLISHQYASVLKDCPRDFDGIREFMRGLDIEGIVFHHQDGRMAKVKKKDYGLKRKA